MKQHYKTTIFSSKFRRFLASYTVLASIVLLISVVGCSKRYHNLPAFSALPITDPANRSVGRFKTSYLADQIHAYFRGNASGPIAVTTFVDIDDLYQTSTFGRILAEQLLSELAMKGYKVVEIRLSDAMQIMYNSGEFSLSRESGVIRDNQEVAALVVGTYSASPVRVYVNARIIDPGTSLVISAGSVEMGKTKEIARLLRSNSFPTTLERIPVRHLGYNAHPTPYYWPHGAAAPMPFAMQQNEEELWELPEERENEQSDLTTPKLPDSEANFGEDGS